MFSEKDLEQIASKGLSLSDIETQIDNFKRGFPFLDIQKAATVGDGILQLNDGLISELIIAYHSYAANHIISKFVPASGAASRMFKSLYGVLQDLKQGRSIDELIKEIAPQSLSHFISNIENFAFFDDLDNALKIKGDGLISEIKNREFAEIIEFFLTEKGLGYGDLPKGLLKFHRNGKEVRTAVEEHLVEGAAYATGKNNSVNIHLTVSPEHLDEFQAKIKDVKEILESTLGVNINVDFSIQKSSTDTIAVDLNNNPFREKDGSILFRPGGHGALLENLKGIDADLIFVKNIDNVVPDRLKEPTVIYKKALAGVLISYRNKIFNYLKNIEMPLAHIHESLLDEIIDFLEKDLCTVSLKDIRIKSKEEKLVYCLQKLNRPIRVCGMVKNEGEPGGGPFWAKNSDDTVSLQIVEGTQIDKSNAHQLDILNNSTHFNPVDLVCSVYDHKGDKFDLSDFRDPQTGFISKKSSDGRDLKAQELPGLWNGAMANWNTIFVEVPIITFNPVKTVFDLLRKEHQGDINTSKFKVR